MSAIRLPKIDAHIEKTAESRDVTEATRRHTASPETSPVNSDPTNVVSLAPIRIMQLECAGARPQVVVLEMGASYLFGRSSACDVIIQSDTVSRRHLELWCGLDQHWYVRDLGSSNGSYLRVGDTTVRITAQQIKVEAGQMVLLGGEMTKVTFLADLKKI
jgi:hypothetical protein